MNIVELPIEILDPNLVPDTRLVPATEEEDAELQASLKKDGQLHNIVVTAPFTTETGKTLHGIACGRRRFFAMQAIGAKTISCEVKSVPVNIDSINGYYADLAAIENMKRAELHPVEIAAEVNRRTELKHKAQDIATKLSIDVNSVYNYQRVAKAPWFSDYINAVKKRQPVPSHRRCLEFLAAFKAPKREDAKAKEAREENAIAAFRLALTNEKEAYEAEVLKAQAEGREPPKPNARGGKGKAKKGDGASTSPRIKWKEVQAWWRAAEAALKSGKLPTAQVTAEGKSTIEEGRPLTHDEVERLTAATATLAWVYQTKGSLSRPDVFVLGEEKTEKPKRGKKAAK